MNTVIISLLLSVIEIGKKYTFLPCSHLPKVQKLQMFGMIPHIVARNGECILSAALEQQFKFLPISSQTRSGALILSNYKYCIIYLTFSLCNMLKSYHH